MQQTQEQILVGTSYSDRFASQYRVRLPAEIKKPADARFESLVHGSHSSDRVISKAFGIILDFDEIATDIINGYRKDRKDLKNFDVKEIFRRFREGHESTGELISVYESVLDDGDINPTTYLNAKRHFTIAKIFLEKFGAIDISKINYDDLELDEGKEENFKLGIFIGLEPILVTSMFSALKRDDAELSQAYGKLIDRYSYMVATMYPSEYISATELNTPTMSARDYSKLLEYIRADRHGQVLL